MSSRTPFTRQLAPVLGGKHVNDDQSDKNEENPLNELSSAIQGKMKGAPQMVKSIPRNVMNGDNGEETKEEGEAREEQTPKRCYKLQFPHPLRPAEPDKLVQGLQLNALKYLVLSAMGCYVFGRLHFSYILGFMVVAAGALAYWLVGRETQQGLDWQLEKLEGARTLYKRRGETVEWLNYFVEKLWRSIDPKFFVAVEDILEDALESIAPAVISAVKVTDFDIGVHAPKIQKIRIFPPVPGQPQEALFGEVSFGFHANPVASLAQSRRATSAPPGIAIRFKTKLKAPIDIKAELTKLRGKLRFKLVTSPDLPFLSKVTISLTSVPDIDTGVMPLSRHMNVMRLPMVKALLNEAIKIGFSDMIDPKWLTIDVKEMIGAATKDTTAIGVIMVTVREAARSEAMNMKDMQDSYASISLSNQPKHSPTPTTRVLTNDKNPRWNENLYILIGQNEIVSDATVDVKVWDADKVKPDDMWGCASIPVRDIVKANLDKLGNVTHWTKEEHTVFDGWMPIDGKERLAASKVCLNFKLSFHPKYMVPIASIFSGLERQKSEEERRWEQEQLHPSHKSGILTVRIIEASELEIGDPQVLTADEFKHPYSSNQIVDPYAVLYVNDHKVYMTRAKMRNPSPHWNADTEQFIKDYDSAFLRISVKASFDLERDPVLGTRVFYLSDMFGNQPDKYKESERWVALANGIGFGKVLLNLKYKPIKLTLPPELRGSDVATMIIDEIRFTSLKAPFSSEDLRFTKAVLALNVDPVIIKRLKSADFKLEDENRADTQKDIIWSKRRVYFPLIMRYRTALYVHLFQGAFTSAKATGRLWLKTVCDHVWQEATVELHGYVSEGSKEANRNEDDWSTGDCFGQAKIRFRVVPGFSPVHSHLQSFKEDMVGADPFHDETLRSKVKQSIKEEQALAEEHVRQQQEDLGRRASSVTELSAEYGEEDVEADERYFSDLREYSKRHPKIPKYGPLRKLSWSTDAIRHKVETFRGGFNSERRASRSVAKE